jgi:hypothetical protein
VLTLFYVKTFHWSDLSLANSLSFWEQYQNTTAVFKTLLSFTPLCKNVSPDAGAILIVVLAIPQLYRFKGRISQQLRVVLGPLTPLVAASNLVKDPLSVATIAGFVVSFAAFVVFRPDNTIVFDLFWKEEASFAVYVDHHDPNINNNDSKLIAVTYLDGNRRRKIHGMLAASNTILALIAAVKPMLEQLQ